MVFNGLEVIFHFLMPILSNIRWRLISKLLIGASSFIITSARSIILITGILVTKTVIINTSFNVMGEPIVNTPEEAIR